MTQEPIVLPIPGAGERADPPRGALAMGLGGPGRLLRATFGLLAACVVAPALTSLAAGLAMMLTSPALSPMDGLMGLLWVLVPAPLLGVVAGALGAGLFLGPWFAAARLFRGVAPGRAAWALAGGAAGFSYVLAAIVLGLAGSGAFAPHGGLPAAVFGVWPAVMGVEVLLGAENFERGWAAFLVAPPPAGLAAGWVYAWIAGKG